MATGSVGANAISARSTFDGRCVKTIVFKRPMRAPSQPAATDDPAWSSPTPKKNEARSAPHRHRTDGRTRRP